jgi:hypothetical protein
MLPRSNVVYSHIERVYLTRTIFRYAVGVLNNPNNNTREQQCVTTDSTINYDIARHVHLNVFNKHSEWNTYCIVCNVLMNFIPY